MAEKTPEIAATGRRKTAVARVRLLPGTGKWTVNKKEAKVYFASETVRSYIAEPLTLTNTLAKFDIIARLNGGGLSGQAGHERRARRERQRALERQRAVRSAYP